MVSGLEVISKTHIEHIFNNGKKYQQCITNQRHL